MSVSTESPENIMQTWLSKADWARPREDKVGGFLSVYQCQNAASHRHQTGDYKDNEGLKLKNTRIWTKNNL